MTSRPAAQQERAQGQDLLAYDTAIVIHTLLFPSPRCDHTVGVASDEQDLAFFIALS